MIRIVFIFYFLISSAYADNREKIIERLKNTSSINFKFEQNISGKIENGNCVIKYPKKIFCKYEKSNDKILVSNGKSLVIKTKTSFYRYPLKKTPLNFILDKNYLIKKIYNFEESKIDNKIISYKIFENENEINIFFDKNTYNLIGWQTLDIYQNLSITYLSSINKNNDLDKKLFKLPTQN